MCLTLKWRGSSEARVARKVLSYKQEADASKWKREALNQGEDSEALITARVQVQQKIREGHCRSECIGPKEMLRVIGALLLERSIRLRFESGGSPGPIGDPGERITDHATSDRRKPTQATQFGQGIDRNRLERCPQ